MNIETLKIEVSYEDTDGYLRLKTIAYDSDTGKEYGLEGTNGRFIVSLMTAAAQELAVKCDTSDLLLKLRSLSNGSKTQSERDG